MSEQSPAVTPPRKRSPSYPAFSLGQSIEWLRELYAAQRQHAAPIETAVRHWGYKGPNGKTNLIISSLKKFGLIVDSGSGRARKIQVTDAGRRILEHPDPSEREAAIQKAALLPPIHREMWEKYGRDMPPDDTWIWNLKEDREFTDTGAREFVKEYKETISLARLDEYEDDEDRDGVELVADEPNTVGETPFSELAEDAGFQQAAARGAYQVAQVMAQPRTHEASARVDVHSSAAHVQSYTLPMGPGKAPVEIRGAFPLTTAEWQVLMASLKVWKPMLVEDAVITAEPDEDEDEDLVD